LKKSLEQEALEIRRGTESVRDHLLKTLEIGSPSVRELAYAVKARIKDDFKIVQKVEKKRIERPDYKVRDLRDIVGLRIVTLYRLDVLHILPIFLERVRENSGKDETKLFLEDPLEEIKIYSVNPNGDTQKLARRVESIFRDLGYANKCDIEQKTENYTSIHMVLWARTKWNKVYLEIPIEVQLRTALEDVWSEMDHQLKYKKEKRVDNPTNTALILNCLAHLNVMKTLNDGLAQYGDQVKIQLDHIDNSIKRSERIRLAEKPEKRLLGFEQYAGKLREDVQELLGRSREAFENGLIDYRVSTRRTSDLSEVDRSLKTFAAEIAELDVSDELKAELCYVVLMEQALVNFEIGKRLGNLAGNEYFLVSQGIYDQMGSAYPDRAIVVYRLSRVLFELGQRDLAIEKMRRLVENYANFDLPDSHWVHASANRVLGFWHWGGIKRETNEPDAKICSDSMDDVLLAARYSFTAGQINVEETNEPVEIARESPRAMALNNMLFFAVEFLESDGSWLNLGKIGISKEVFANSSAQLMQYEVEAGADFRRLNTLRRVCLHNDKLDDAKRYAHEAVEQLRVAGVVDRGGATVEEHVLRRCLQTIA
jgi:ppGpp synthetase/RelA/SpoT-type nucleotidyltranferase